jgi:hypothetical protein
MTRPAMDRAAGDLHEYVRFRSIKQGVSYALSPDWFRQALRVGCRRFFGITIGERGTLIKDVECPDFFEEWKREADARH